MGMRIIAGTHRGRRLLPPKDQNTTRPITDRVKQSLFDRLWSMGVLPSEEGPESDAEIPDEPGAVAEGQAAKLPGALDIFCGTGSLGLEALSRGIEHCTFVDMDRDAISRLNKNLVDTGLADRARVVKGSALSPIWLGQVKAGTISVIFLDPPYAMAEDEKGQQDLVRLMTELSRVASDDCVLSYRTSKHITPPPADGWNGPTSHHYGSMALHFYERG